MGAVVVEARAVVLVVDAVPVAAVKPEALERLLPEAVYRLHLELMPGLHLEVAHLEGAGKDGAVVVEPDEVTRRPPIQTPSPTRLSST